MSKEKMAEKSTEKAAETTEKVAEKVVKISETKVAETKVEKIGKKITTINMPFDPFGIIDENDYRQMMTLFGNTDFQEIQDHKTNTCRHCNCELQRNINNISDTCDNCGIITEDVTEEYINVADLMNNKLRIVGYNCNHFQPDLYRSDNGNINILQKKHIMNEYKDYRQKYIESGGVPFPLTACELATDFYNLIQQHCVKRSQNKKSIMAACLWIACLQIDFAPSKTEISKFMQLPHKGIARGSNFIRTLVSNKKINIDPNINPLYPEIKTLFLQLNYTDDKYKKLHEIIYKIIEIASNNLIGVNSMSRSKVNGTTYIVLRRCNDRDLVPVPPVNTKEFCKDNIMKNTIDRYINEINSYHSYFKDYYESENLRSTMPL
jgi:hypothetical protein